MNIMDEDLLRIRQSTGVLNVYDTLKTIEINLINNCNRTCSFCPHGDPSYHYTYGRCDKKVIDSLVNQLNEHNYSNRISICGFGEPLLHSDIYEYVSSLRQLNCTIELVTNGDLLTSKSINDLYQSGVDIVNVSVYEEELLPTYYDMFKTISPDKFLIRPRFSNINLVNRIGILNKHNLSVNNPCYLPSYKLLLDYNGDVLLCCNDWSRENVYGNILTTDIYEIWLNVLSKKRLELIHGVRSGTCKSCDINGTLYGKDIAEYFKKNS